MGISRTLYAVLGVEPAATTEEIEAAYLCLQREGGDIGLLRMAYDTLRIPEQRAAYDRKLARQQAAAAHPVSMENAGGTSRVRLWLVLLLIVGGVGYYWMQRAKTVSRPANTAPSAVAAVQPEHAALPVPVQAEVAVVDGDSVAADPPTSSARNELVVAVRGPKTQAFDPEYLAWSAFQIRQRRSAGSGVLIGQDRILTNCHVLAGGAMGIVVIHSLTKRVTKVEKYARLEGDDACLLYAPGAGGEVIEWGRASDLKPGELVYSFGHPGGSTDLIWSEAPFLAQVSFGGTPYLQTANYCRPGSSGGPLLDGNGRLVGIVTRGQVSERGGVTSYGACYSLTEASARQLLGKSLFPIGFAPSQYSGN